MTTRKPNVAALTVITYCVSSICSTCHACICGTENASIHGKIIAGKMFTAIATPAPNAATAVSFAKRSVAGRIGSGCRMTASR